MTERADLQRLVVSTFPNAKALPLWIAQENALFQRFGLDVELDVTKSSKAQREKLVSGEIHIAQAAVDNALSLIRSGHDVVIVMGGEGGMNDFIVQNDVRDFGGMRGRLLAVDSPDTAYALQARKLLARAGLQPGRDYDLMPVGNASRRLQVMLDDRRVGAAVLNPPYSSEALVRGLRSLGNMTNLLGPYQAGGAFVRRAWAQANGSKLEAYIKVYIQALGWLANFSNEEAAIDLLGRRLRIRPEIGATAYRQLVDSSFGFTPGARVHLAGLENVLAIRAGTEGADASLDSNRILDLSYYEHAIGQPGLIDRVMPDGVG